MSCLTGTVSCGEGGGALEPRPLSRLKAVWWGAHTDMRGGFQPQFPLADPKRDVFPVGLIVKVTEL